MQGALRTPALALALLLLPALLPLQPTAEAASVTPLGDLPTEFLGATAVWTGEAVYLFGGRGAGNVYRDDILRYDPATGTSTHVGDLPASTVGPAARQSMAGVWTGTKAYLFGGAVVDPGSGTPRSIHDIVVFDPATGRAENVNTGAVDALPEPVFGMGAAWIGGKAYLFGGLKFSFAGSATNITWQDSILVFDPNAPVGQDKVTRLNTRLPYPVQDMATVVHDGDAYLLGGLAVLPAEDGQDDLRPTSTIVRFDPDRRTASLLDVNMPRRLHFHAATVLDGTVYVLGGREARESADGRHYAVTSDAILEWRPGTAPREHPLTLPIPRYAAGVARTPDGVLLLGGRDSGDHTDGMANVMLFSPEPGPPSAPTDLQVDQGTRVLLTWGRPTYDGGAPVQGYTIERVAEDGAVAVVAQKGPDTRSVVDETAPGTGVVTYRVRAFNAEGEGTAAVARVELGPRPPDPPKEASAFAGNAEVDLRWTPPAATGGSAIVAYVIERLDETGSNATLEVNATSWNDVNVTNGATYTYRIAARNSLGVGEYVTTAPAVPKPVPAAPDGLSTEDTGAEVQIRWNPVADATAYEVLRGRSPLSLDPIATVASTDHVDATVQGGTTYWYAVRALNEHGGGIPTGAVAVARLEPPTEPWGLSTIAGRDFVRLQWSPPNATGGVPESEVTYLVERARIGEASFVVQNDLQSTAWTDRSVDPGSTYAYTVAAVNMKGRGNSSAPVVVEVSLERNAPPRAALRATPAGTVVGVDVTLDASFSSDPDGRVADYFFDFGDGTGTDWILTPTVSHVYGADGVYTASVRVRDEQGTESASALARVIIGPPPDEEDRSRDLLPRDDENETPEIPPPGTETPTRLPAPGLAALAAAALAAALARRR